MSWYQQCRILLRLVKICPYLSHNVVKTVIIRFVFEVVKNWTCLLCNCFLCTNIFSSLIQMDPVPLCCVLYAVWWDTLPRGYWAVCHHEGPEFKPPSVCAVFVMDQVSMGEVFWVYRVSSVSSFAPLLHTHSYSHLFLSEPTPYRGMWLVAK